MAKKRVPRSLSEFLRDHDVPCASCGYNLRGGVSTTCPECGYEFPYTTLTQFMADHASFQRVETTEYRLYRSISRFVISVIAMNALLILFVDWFGEFLVRLVFTILGLLLAAAILWLRHCLYRSPKGADYVTDPRAERHRDRFGAFCLIITIPLVWLLIALLGHVR